MRVHTEKQRLQRRCYSHHKNRPLVKTMMVIWTDGYITSAIGPYCKYIYCVYYKYINTILKCLQLFPALYDMICSKYLLHLHLFTEWFQENDVLVVDRGSRNLVEFLEEGEYRVQIIKTAH